MPNIIQIIALIVVPLGVIILLMMLAQYRKLKEKVDYQTLLVLNMARSFMGTEMTPDQEQRIDDATAELDRLRADLESHPFYSVLGG